MGRLWEWSAGVGSRPGMYVVYVKMTKRQESVGYRLIESVDEDPG